MYHFDELRALMRIKTALWCVMMKRGNREITSFGDRNTLSMKMMALKYVFVGH